MITFDAVAGVVAPLNHDIAAATHEHVETLIGRRLTRVKLTEIGRFEIEPLPSARPFFVPREELLLAPPDGSEALVARLVGYA